MKKPTMVRTVAFPATFLLWALVGAACGPLPPCQSDVQLGATYHVSLVAKSSPVPYAIEGRHDPSCGALDKLDAGFALDIAIPQNGPHPEYDEGRCWVPQGDITSDVGLPLVPVDGLAGFHPRYVRGPMFVRSADFSVGDCVGGWSFMTIDEPADPYNGIAARRWAGRLAWLDLTAECQAAYPGIVTPTNGWCYDEWDVDLQVR